MEAEEEIYPGEGEREIANNKNGFLWDNCKRNGVSYRTYGEFIGDNGPNIPVLKGSLLQGFFTVGICQSAIQSVSASGKVILIHCWQ